MSRTILVIDSGGTKSDWALIEGDSIKKGTSEGLHPNFLNEDQLIENAQTIAVSKNQTFDQILFYGAGCANQNNINKVERSLKQVFQSDEIRVEHDLYGAARAGLGKEPGYVVILGTGSVGAYYNGKEIKEFTGGLGYLFGDEGSGAYLGKILLLKWFKKQLSDELGQRLQHHLGSSEQETIAAIYQSERPNQKLAALTYWIKENDNHPEIKNIIQENFLAFEKDLLIPMIQNHKAQKIVFIGGVAHTFSKSIQILCEKFQLSPTVIQKPIDLLAKYHLKIS